jgi:hypothetical protein
MEGGDPAADVIDHQPAAPRCQTQRPTSVWPPAFVGRASFRRMARRITKLRSVMWFGSPAASPLME